MSNLGIGPVITAGLLAHIDLESCRCIQYKGIPRHKRPKHKCPGLTSAGAIWTFAGLMDPKDQPWEKGQKRPYNAALKTLCWKLGESFKKVSGNLESLYGQLYRQRKEFEVANNENGLLKEQAQLRLEKAKRGRYQISPEQRKTWESGKLQAMGLDLRAMRYAVKIFLSHFHCVGREILTGEVVKPWIIVHGGHTEYIPPPNWPMEE